MKFMMSSYVAAALFAAASSTSHAGGQTIPFVATDASEKVERPTSASDQSKQASISVNAKAVGEGARDLVYTPIQPCRIVDTRLAIGPLAAGVIRDYFAALTTYGGQGGDNRDCGVPGNAAAVQANLIAIGPDNGGFLTVWPAGAGQPTASNLNYIATDSVRSNAATIPLAASTLFSVFTSRPVNLVVDVVGYFAPPVTAAGGGADSWVGLPGGGNVASGVRSTVVAGSNNVAPGNFSTVGGGSGNTVYGGGSVVAGGAFNTAGFSGDGANDPVYATVSGGSSNNASADGSMVPGGFGNSASGFTSFAAGNRAKSTRNGQFTWSDSREFDFNPEAAGSFGGGTLVRNTFMVRATGGIAFYSGINATTGALTSVCYINPSGTGWSCASDRNLKQGFQQVSPKQVLQRLVGMPISTWNMIGSAVRQMGPMSQDFHKAFGLGSDDKSINQIDAQGVAFAAIQGLHEVVKERDAQISKLERANATMQRELTAIKKKLGL